MLGCLYVKINEDRFGFHRKMVVEILKIVINVLEIRNHADLISEVVDVSLKEHGIFFRV